jgi:hypothetical protein
MNRSRFPLRCCPPPPPPRIVSTHAKPISANVSSFGYVAAVAAAAAEAVDSDCVRSSNAARDDDDDDVDPSPTEDDFFPSSPSLGSRTGGDDVRGRSLRDITFKCLAVVVGGGLLASEEDNIGDDAAGAGGVGEGRLPLEKPNDVRSMMAFFVGVVLPPLALLFLEVTMVKDGRVYSFI